MTHPVAVVGAGPFGLSAAAHLRARGLAVRVFGEPMASWRAHMPAGMTLMSPPAESAIAAPGPGHTLADYRAQAGAAASGAAGSGPRGHGTSGHGTSGPGTSGPRTATDAGQLVPLETFVAYGDWFGRRLVPDLERARVVAVERVGDAPSPGTGRQGAGRPGRVATGRGGPRGRGLPGRCAGLPGLSARAGGRPAGFEVTLDSGERFTACAVVVATGLTGFEHLPRELAGYGTRPWTSPAFGHTGAPGLTGPVSHSWYHHDLARFSGADLVVVGAGQSALETAVLAAEAGARVRVVARGHDPVAFAERPGPGAPEAEGAAPDVRDTLGCHPIAALSRHPEPYRLLPPRPYRLLPAAVRGHLARRVPGPLGAWWLQERFDNAVTVREVQGIVRAGAPEGRPSLIVRTHQGRIEEITTDHVIAATGYRVDLRALGFLGQGLLARLRTRGGAPRLGPGLCSSVPGLYFTGAAAAYSYGPVMRFLSGTRVASPCLARHVAAAQDR